MPAKKPGFRGSTECCQIHLLSSLPYNFEMVDYMDIDKRIYNSNRLTVLLSGDQSEAIKRLKTKHRFQEIGRFPGSGRQDLIILFSPRKDYKLSKKPPLKPNRWIRK